MPKRVRPLTPDEHARVVDYFHSAGDDLLKIMGVERVLLKPRDGWLAALLADLDRPLEERQRFYVGWELDGALIGHSMLSDIEFGKEARIHLHIWVSPKRRGGLGSWFFSNSAAFFIETFQLQTLICEPHAENPAPNALLKKVGFHLVRSYWTRPGAHCFEQVVNRYEIDHTEIDEIVQRVGD